MHRPRPALALALALLAAAPAALAAGEASWRAIPLPDDLFCTPIVRDFAASPTLLLAVGSCSSFYSRDGGESWTRHAMLEPGNWHGMDFLGPLGVLAGRNSIFQPTIGVTLNGGTTWSFVPSYIQNNEGTFRAVKVLSWNTYLAAGHLWDGTGFVARTTDGGRRWQVLEWADAPLLDMDFGADGLLGVAVGVGGVALVTLDGGLEWDRVDTRTAAHLFDVDVTLDAVLAAGAGGTVVRSRDAGATWEPLATGTTADLYALDVADGLPLPASRALAGGADGVVISTADGGDSWSAEDLGTDADVLALRYIAPADASALAGGIAGTLWRSP